MSEARDDVFEAERPRLLSLAYQMLGEVTAAEDVVQEAWLRWHGTDQKKVRAPQAWLSSVVTRLAIDQLRSARQRRESYTGTWLPEPILENEDAPADALELARQCELALLCSLERLDVEERAAFLLRRVFDTDYADIAGVLGRSEQACRQLVSRAGNRVRDEGRKVASAQDKLEDMLLRFSLAAAAGDKATVLELLAPDVVAVSDGGGVVRAALIPLEGPERVAQVMTHIASKAQREAPDDIPEIARVNGRPAFVQMGGTERDMIFTLRLNDAGEICWIYTLRNPHKLELVRLRR
ncbi:MAG: RNA polymerase sigma factor SigJ [Halioglobus sp.]|nr:RNA polymerase sigma factor SigJ [Halioglobus sp.]